MYIQQTTFGDLHTRTQTRVQNATLGNLNDTSRVFVARQGTRIVGTASVQHVNGVFRDLIITVQARNADAQTALTQAAREATRHLKRRTVIEGA